MQKDDDDFSAVIAGVGRNDSDHGSRNAMFVEGTRHRGANSFYGRFEAVQSETSLLLTDRIVDAAGAHDRDTVFAVTAGIVRNVLKVSGFEGGFGADVTWHGAPDSLSAAYGARPFGLHLFFRLRPPAGAMGRMLNMRMSQPMGGHI